LPDARTNTLKVELRNAGVRDAEFSEGAVGGEAALVATYHEGGRKKALLSTVRDGIEYRIAVAATSGEQHAAALAAIERAFVFPDAAAAERARSSLPTSANAAKAARSESGRR
jgi:hypothetical protein